MGFIDQVRVVRRALDLDGFGQLVAMWWVSAGITGHLLLLLFSTLKFLELDTPGWQVADLVIKISWVALQLLSLFSIPVSLKAKIDFWALFACTVGVYSWIVFEVVNAIQQGTQTLEWLNMLFNDLLGVTAVLILLALSPLSGLLLVAHVLVRLSSTLAGSHSAAFYVVVVFQFLFDAAAYVVVSFSFSVLPAMAWRLHHDARRASTSNLSYSL